MSASHTQAAPDAASDGRNEPEISLEDRLQLESGTIGWPDLVRHFARGVVLRIDGATDLLAVAATLVTDDVGAFATLVEAGSLRRASDDDARDWVVREPGFRCVVVAPWVLVQELH